VAVVNTKLMRYKGLTALQAAAQVGNQALVERLLDAVFMGHEEVVEFLKKVEMEKRLSGKGIG
jgi:hypothetical protein